MVVGHLGVALGARARWRDVALPWLVLAAYAPDLVDAALPAHEDCGAPGVLSHSLPAALVLIAAFGLASRWRTGAWRAAAVLAALVVAHIAADYLTGAKVPWRGGPVIGLDLYDWPWVDFAMEAVVIVAGWWMLRGAAAGARWVRSWIALAALLVAQAQADRTIAHVRRATKSCALPRPGAAPQAVSR